MQGHDELIGILNDLVRINNDRVEGYEKAVRDIRDTINSEIKAMFFQHAEDSRQYRSELEDAIRQLGGEPAESSTASGKIYRAWMEVKAKFSGNDIKAALESCEFGEDAALKAYQHALQEDVAWPSDVSAVVSNHRQEIRAAHDKIKRYRDQYRTISTE